jgi:hypothetical protein
MAAADHLDEIDLSNVNAGGQVHEDLMDRLWDISPEDLPFQDMIATGDSSNHLKEFIEEQLEAANPNNYSVDGEDPSSEDSQTGRRLGNYHQTSVKRVVVSDRARNVNSVGTSDELIKQVSKRQRALRRDVEARLTSNKPAVRGDANTVASQCAGIGGFIGSTHAGSTGGTTNDFRGAATGASPILSGYSSDTDTGGYPATGPVAGTKRALTEALLKSALRACYDNGGNVKYAMGRPAVIEAMSDYMFTSSARVATLQSNVMQDNRAGVNSGNGTASDGVVAQGSVNIYVGNFGSVTFVPNRFQPVSATGASDLFIIDPDLWEVSYLQGYRIKRLGDTGLSTKRLISVDYTLCALAERGNAVIADIDETLAMTA